MSEYKACRKCGAAKPLNDFPKCNYGKHRQNTCTTCKSAQRRAAERADPDHALKQRARAKRWRHNNPEQYRINKDRDVAARRERLGQKSWDERLAALAIAREAKRIARDTARLERLALLEADRVERIKLKPWTDPALTSADKFRIQYRLDPVFNLKQRVRNQIKKKMAKKGIADLMRGAINRGGKSNKIEHMLGYSIADLKRHLESKFTEGMTWDAFLTGDIVIDHIKPLARHCLEDEAEALAAWQLSNLQPLWSWDNMAKGAKWNPDDVPSIDDDWRDAQLNVDINRSTIAGKPVGGLAGADGVRT